MVKRALCINNIAIYVHENRFFQYLKQYEQNLRFFGRRPFGNVSCAIPSMYILIEALSTFDCRDEVCKLQMLCVYVVSQTSVTIQVFQIHHETSMTKKPLQEKLNVKNNHVTKIF